MGVIKGDIEYSPVCDHQVSFRSPCALCLKEYIVTLQSELTAERQRADDLQALITKRAAVRVTCHDAVLKYRERAEALRADLRAVVEALLCHRTNHPCGTDTMVMGSRCLCPACIARERPGVVAVMEGK